MLEVIFFQWKNICSMYDPAKTVFYNVSIRSGSGSAVGHAMAYRSQWEPHLLAR